MTTRPFIELIKVTKIYQPEVVALKEVSLSVAKGEMVFLTGESGAGKTTLLKLLCRMECQNNGMVEVAGQDLSRIRAREIPAFRKRIGMVYQDFKLLPALPVFDNIAMAMEVHYTPRPAIRARVAELLKMLRLEGKERTLAARLSRGEQQRVAIARAIAHTPALLLADEPTGNLDAALTELVVEIFKKMNAGGTTIVFASHNENVYRHTHRRILVLRRGELILANPVDVAAARRRVETASS